MSQKINLEKSSRSYKMDISVIIPTYNRKRVLKRCLDSLSKQAYNSYEIVVADDGSADGTEEMVKSLKNKKIIYLKQQNLGCAAARNLGAKNSNGRIVALTDDDCILDKNWLKEIIATF